MEGDLITTSFFGAIERLVRGSQEIGWLGATVERAERGSDAHGDRFMRWKGAEAMTLDGASQAVGYRTDLISPDLWEQDHELISTVAPQNVGGPQLSPEDPSQGRQNGVTRLV